MRAWHFIFWEGLEVGWLHAGDSLARPGERSLPERLSRLESKAKFGPSPSGRARQPLCLLWETSSCGISRRLPHSAGPQAAKGAFEQLPKPLSSFPSQGQEQRVARTPHSRYGERQALGKGEKKSLGRAQGGATGLAGGLQGVLCRTRACGLI